MKMILASIALCLLPACGTVQGNGTRNQSAPPETKQTRTTPPAEQGPTYGSETAMSGVYETRFEHAEFNGCWLDFTREASDEFRRRFPRDSADSPMRGRRYQLEVMGRRTLPNGPEAPNGYGHLNGWNCQIEVTRVISAEVLGPY